MQVILALQSGWIWAHIIGAATGFGAVLTVAGMGLMYLLKEKNGGMYENLPKMAVLDDLEYRFVADGFIRYGLVIVSDSFCSNQVKGKYWEWDPVEVW
jgi:ABC-type transport system involved in cytochrome c biogenesis permease subunit